MKPKVVIVDNEIDNVHNFQGAFDDVFDVIPAEIKDDFDEMVDYLLSLNADGYVFDYRFTDTMPKIKYTGAELYNRIVDSKHEIPVIVLTGQEDKMQHKIYDPYHIVSKESLDNIEQFKGKLLQLVSDYKSLVDLRSKRLKELVAKKQKGGLEMNEEVELIELDTYLDKVIYKKDVVPEELKKSQIDGRLDKLIENTQKILDGLGKK